MLKCFNGRNKRQIETGTPLVLGIVSIYHACLIPVSRPSKDGQYDQVHISGGRRMRGQIGDGTRMWTRPRPRGKKAELFILSQMKKTQKPQSPEMRSCSHAMGYQGIEVGAWTQCHRIRNSVCRCHLQDDQLACMVSILTTLPNFPVILSVLDCEHTLVEEIMRSQLCNGTVLALD